MISFLNKEQKNAIISGGEKRKDLEQFLKEVCAPDVNRNIRHAYVGGTAGFGKSHSVFSAAEASGLPVKVVKGQTSLHGLAQSLAVLKATYPVEPILVIIDDCDKLFTNQESLNAMKAVLEDGFNEEGKYNGEFKYEKNMHLNSIPEGLKRDSVELFMNDGESGFVIPLDNFRFIITSNSGLPSAKSKRVLANKIKLKGLDPESDNTYNKMSDRNAIRTRCRYRHVDASQEELWGSFASILLQETEQSDISQEEKTVLLNWLWMNREDSSDFDYRTVLDMCDDIRELGIEKAIDRWDFNYL